MSGSSDHRFRVQFGRGAAQQFEDLRPHDRGRLLQVLNAYERHPPAAGLATLGTNTQVAACEVFERERVILVYAVISRDDGWRLLTGRPLDWKFRHRRMRRRRGIT